MTRRSNCHLTDCGRRSTTPQCAVYVEIEIQTGMGMAGGRDGNTCGSADAEPKDRTGVRHIGDDTGRVLARDRGLEWTTSPGVAMTMRFTRMRFI